MNIEKSFLPFNITFNTKHIWKYFIVKYATHKSGRHIEVDIKGKQDTYKTNSTETSSFKAHPHIELHARTQHIEDTQGQITNIKLGWW